MRYINALAVIFWAIFIFLIHEHKNITVEYWEWVTAFIPPCWLAIDVLIAKRLRVWTGMVWSIVWAYATIIGNFLVIGSNLIMMAAPELDWMINFFVVSAMLNLLFVIFLGIKRIKISVKK